MNDVVCNRIRKLHNVAMQNISLFFNIPLFLKKKKNVNINNIITVYIYTRVYMLCYVGKINALLLVVLLLPDCCVT